jgi:hypothetical protein
LNTLYVSHKILKKRKCVLKSYNVYKSELSTITLKKVIIEEGKRDKSRLKLESNDKYIEKRNDKTQIRSKREEHKYKTLLYKIFSILLLLSHVSRYVPKHAVLRHLHCMFLGAADQVPHPETGNI